MKTTEFELTPEKCQELYTQAFEKQYGKRPAAETVEATSLLDFTKAILGGTEND